MEKLDKTIEVNIEIDSEELDQVIEKANRLVELLREARQIVNSLSSTEMLETDREQHVSKSELEYLRDSAENAVIADLSNKIDGALDEIQKKKRQFDKTEKAFSIAANIKSRC